MLNDRESALLHYLRNNSRKSLAQIGSLTDIPVSTLFDILRKLESDIIIKHVSIMDFSKIGYNLKVCFIISAQKKNELKEFLMSHKNVNNLSSLSCDYDFIAECIFKEFKDMVDFKEQLEQFEIKYMQNNYIVEQIKTEGFSRF